jgi:hypothetical protein
LPAFPFEFECCWLTNRPVGWCEVGGITWWQRHKWFKLGGGIPFTLEVIDEPVKEPLFRREVIVFLL